NGLPEVRFTAEALALLQRLPYPGNVRELKNLVERTILISGKSLIDTSDFDVQHEPSSAKASVSSSLSGMTLDEMEKQTILQAMKEYDGNVSRMAVALGISRAALYRRLAKYGIPVDN
ncbi:MAG: helix-turn-helix domain-containing protein, partial [Parabacteroides sp.]|nr:helix-turn-helix domain-containing protein [Parabacteroides sp.]